MPVSSPLVAGVAAVAVTVAVAGAVVAFRQRDVPGAQALLAFEAVTVAWVLLETARTFAPGYRAAVAFERASQVGLVLSVLAWLLFAAEYTGREWLLKPRVLALIALEPVGYALLVWTGGLHDLVWADVVAADTAAGFAVVGFGPAYWIHLAYSAVVVVVGAGLLVGAARSREGRRGRLSAALAVAAVVPAAVAVASTAGYSPLPGVDATPFASVVPGAVLVWALSERNLLDVPPIVPAVDHGTIVDGVADGVVVVDAGGRIVECNPTAATFASVESPVGTEFEAAFPTLSESVGDADSERRQVRLDDGRRERYFEFQASAIDPADYRKGTVVTLHDVTDRVIRDQRLDVLNRVLRHNVRQETNVILGHSQVLEDAADDEVDPHTDALKDAASNLAEWSDQARRIERVLERATAERHPVDAADVAREVVRDARDRFPGATFEVDAPTSAHASAHESLAEAVDEVVENAVVHGTTSSPGGSDDQGPDPEDATVEVTVERDGDDVVVAVADRGPGIPEDEREVFDRGRETPLEHGSGLGLWLVKWILYASGGEVSIENRDPRGSVVRLRVPRADSMWRQRQFETAIETDD